MIEPTIMLKKSRKSNRLWMLMLLTKVAHGKKGDGDPLDIAVTVEVEAQVLVAVLIAAMKRCVPQWSFLSFFRTCP